jgi:hypothetical protein
MKGTQHRILLFAERFKPLPDLVPVRNRIRKLKLEL